MLFLFHSTLHPVQSHLHWAGIRENLPFLTKTANSATYSVPPGKGIFSIFTVFPYLQSVLEGKLKEWFSTATVRRSLSQLAAPSQVLQSADEHFHLYWTVSAPWLYSTTCSTQYTLSSVTFNQVPVSVLWPISACVSRSRSIASLAAFPSFTRDTSADTGSASLFPLSLGPDRVIHHRYTVFRYS